MYYTIVLMAAMGQWSYGGASQNTTPDAVSAHYDTKPDIAWKKPTASPVIAPPSPLPAAASGRAPEPSAALAPPPPMPTPPPVAAQPKPVPRPSQTPMPSQTPVQTPMPVVVASPPPLPSPQVPVFTIESPVYYQGQPYVQRVIPNYSTAIPTQPACVNGNCRIR